MRAACDGAFEAFEACPGVDGAGMGGHPSLNAPAPASATRSQATCSPEAKPGGSDADDLSSLSSADAADYAPQPQRSLSPSGLGGSAQFIVYGGVQELSAPQREPLDLLSALGLDEAPASNDAGLPPATDAAPLAASERTVSARSVTADDGVSPALNVEGLCSSAVETDPDVLWRLLDEQAAGTDGGVADDAVNGARRVSSGSQARHTEDGSAASMDSAGDISSVQLSDDSESS